MYDGILDNEIDLNEYFHLMSQFGGDSFKEINKPMITYQTINFKMRCSLYYYIWLDSNIIILIGI